jgi:hypothetical protein
VPGGDRPWVHQIADVALSASPSRCPNSWVMALSEDSSPTAQTPGLTFEMPMEWPSVAHSPVREIIWYWY